MSFKRSVVHTLDATLDATLDGDGPQPQPSQFLAPSSSLLQLQDHHEQQQQQAAMAVDQEEGPSPPFKLVGEMPLTEQCHHYNTLSEVPWDLQKYWQQRYSLFAYYDDDIHLTDDAWFGVTPEPVATRIAADMANMADMAAAAAATAAAASSSEQQQQQQKKKTPAPATTVVDLFAGAGGNAIAFALSGRWARVVAVEKDAATLACAQHNAWVYGAYDAITWVHGDSLAYLAQLRAAPEALDPALRLDPAATVLFASPPWGGVGYRDHDVFDLDTMHPYNLRALHEACRPLEHALYLPRTSDIRQIAKLAPKGKKIEVVQYCMEGASKAMVAYIPAEEKDEQEDSPVA